MRALTYILQAPHGGTEYFLSTDDVKGVNRKVAPSKVIGIRTMVDATKGPIIHGGLSSPFVAELDAEACPHGVITRGQCKKCVDGHAARRKS